MNKKKRILVVSRNRRIAGVFKNRTKFWDALKEIERQRDCSKETIDGLYLLSDHGRFKCQGQRFMKANYHNLCRLFRNEDKTEICIFAGNPETSLVPLYVIWDIPIDEILEVTESEVSSILIFFESLSHHIAEARQEAETMEDEDAALLACADDHMRAAFDAFRTFVNRKLEKRYKTEVVTV